LNRKELSRKEEDIITVHDSSFLTVYEPKLKVSMDHLQEILLCSYETTTICLVPFWLFTCLCKSICFRLKCLFYALDGQYRGTLLTL
jgi:hypothetical protein